MTSDLSTSMLSMLESSPAGVLFLDKGGRIISANVSFAKIVGLEPAALQGTELIELTESQDGLRGLKSFSGSHEVAFLHKDGSTVWTLLHFSGAKDQILCIVQTMTAPKRSEARFRTLFDQAPFSVQLLSQEGTTLHVNRTWLELWHATIDYARQNVVNKYNVFEDPQLEQTGILDLIRAAYRGESVHTLPISYDPQETGHVGRKRWVRAYIHPIKDEYGAVKEVMLIHLDETERVESEAKLKEAMEAAESSNRLKSAFLANMSHEIRTPLTAVLGFASLLRKPDLDQQKREEYLRIIERSGNSLTQVIDDILDISSVEANRLRIERRKFKLREILGEACDLFSIEAESRDLKLTLKVAEQVPEHLYSDPMRIKQILINLIGNALKFTPKGEVKVDVQMSGDGRLLKILVMDTGIGIPEDYRRFLFEPFSQLDNSSTRRFGGTGLGLALSRRLAQALGSDVLLLHSSPEQGSTFAVHLPIESVTPQQEPKVKVDAGTMLGSSGSLMGIRILCAEDSEDNRMLFEILLRQRQAKVEFAEEGEQAVQMALNGRFDVVLMDIQMPVMDGFAATRELRAKGFKKPIIAVTAHAMNNEYEKCLAAGCDAHIAKPVNINNLVQVIRSVL